MTTLCLPSISLLLNAYNSTHASTEIRRSDIMQTIEQSCTYLAKNKSIFGVNRMFNMLVLALCNSSVELQNTYFMQHC